MKQGHETARRAGPGLVLGRPAWLLVIVVAVALQAIAGGSLFGEHRVALAAGLPLLLLGVGLAAWVIRAMAAAGTSPDGYRDDHELLTEGVFRVSRNPFYVGALLAMLGVALVVNGAWLLLLPLGFAVIFSLQVRQEERYLERRFGEPFLQYRRQVRRWI